MKHLFACFSLLIVILFGTSSAIFAQASSSQAEVRGQVLDAAGAAIPNAKLTLTDVSKGTTRTATSDSEGNYLFIGLLPSTYEITTEVSGFSTKTVRFELTVGQQANVPITLTAGAVREAVNIVAA
ncbi:MAG TPA: carboxypeptidase-like regulatory domain-containing protein, partial [Blastocatellia bacterium]|nr:carboxypeptidase-like regulatory domain-containing protein [Blastocatellia bacterium]